MENISLLKDILEKYENAKNSFSEIHQESINDIRFAILGDQWDSSIAARRKADGRSVIVNNKMVANIRYVVNSTMKSSPSILVHALNSDKEEESKVIAGLVRYIETESNAKDKYTAALNDSVAGGLGVFEVVVEEVKPGVMEPRIKRIVDATSVFPDPSAVEPDMSDMQFLFRIKTVNKKLYKKLYPDVEIPSSNDNIWYKEDSVSLLEYWEKEDDGSVCWYVLTGDRIIDSSKDKEEPYLGKLIPFCFVIGEDVIVDGERHFKSIIRDCKDAQYTLNYMESEAVDYVQKHAKSPYLTSDKSIEGFEEQWANVNTSNDSNLIYKEGTTQPKRIEPPQAPIGYIDSINRLDKDIRQTIGIRDPLQDIPASNSGKAIQLQLAQGNVGTYVWIDHLNRAIKYCGKILVDLIPHYFNYPHIQNILGSDGLVKTVAIKTAKYDENTGEVKYIDLSGDYSVSLSTGANYEDQKSETQDKLLELFRMNPALMQIGGDIFVRAMDFAESDELANRITQTMDPKILSQSKSSEMQLKLQLNEMQQEFQKVNGMIQQLTQVLNAKSQEVEILNAKLSEKQSQEMLDMEKNKQDNETILLKTHMENNVEQQKIESDERIKLLELELEKLKIMFQKPDVKIQNYTETHSTVIPVI